MIQQVKQQDLAAAWKEIDRLWEEARLLREKIATSWELGAGKTHVRAESDSGQSIPHNTWTTVIYEDEIYDTLEEYNPATGVFTAQLAGHRHVHAALLFVSTTTWAATERALLAVFKEGTVYSHFRYETDHSAANIYVHVGGGMTVYLDAQDTLDVRIIQNSGAALALISTNAYYNWLTIDGMS